MTENSSYPRNGYIPALDGFRAIAVLMVLIAHGRAKIFPTSVLNSSFGYLLDQGRFGVMTFFVISGYLITTLLLRENSREGISLGDFTLRRALRILPAFYTYLIFVSILKSVNLIHVTWANIACAAGFIYNYHYYLIPDGPSHLPLVSWFVGHSWTLAVEEQFYLIWPLSMVFLARARGSAVVITAALACIASRITLYFGFPALRPGLANSLIGVADPLLAGCLLAYADASPRSRSQLVILTRHLPPLAILLVLPIADRTGFYWLHSGWGLTVGNATLSVFIGLMIFGCITRPDSRFTRFLETPLMRYLGRRSYGIYLWQQIFLIPNSETMIEKFPINFFATFVAAELSFRFVEQPFLRLKDRLRGAVVSTSLQPSPRT